MNYFKPVTRCTGKLFRATISVAFFSLFALALSETAAAQGRQSPIDIVLDQTVAAPLPQIVSNYLVSTVTVVHTFDPSASPIVPKEFSTLRVNVPAGSFVTLNGVIYDLLQFHFHTPSEHTVNSRYAPMEIHFVHLKRNACLGDPDALLVIGAGIFYGFENRELNKIFGLPLPVDSTSPALSIANFNLANVLPNLESSWRYPGSLTAPSNVGCNNPAGSVSVQLASDVFPENVSWVVLTKPIFMSRRQIRKFQVLFDAFGNSRPTQLLNGRTVFRDQFN